MQANVQYELFEANDDMSILQKEIVELRLQQNNVRRGIFARHDELAKLYVTQQNEIDRLKLIIQDLRK